MKQIYRLGLISIARIVCLHFYPLLLSLTTHAQTVTNRAPGDFSVLHYFANNPDGAQPLAGVILISNTLYGTTFQGGTNGSGVVFAVNTNGADYNILYQFSPLTNVPAIGDHPSNYDGANPRGALTVLGNSLFGTTGQGGPNLNGTLFSLSLDGSHFTTLFSFPGSTLSWQALSSPTGDLVPVDNIFYGVTSLGYNALGVVYAIGTNGMNFNPLFTFTDRTAMGDGPSGGVALLGRSLYGMTFQGGTTGNGNIYAVNTNGTGFAQLYSFPSSYWNSAAFANTNSTGNNPVGQMRAAGGRVFGMTEYGGVWGGGTVFTIRPDGSGLVVLHAFTAPANGGTNVDGAYPLTDLIVAGDMLYGSTVSGGNYGSGVIFSISTDGSVFNVLHHLNGPSEGYAPNKLLLSGNTLYGATRAGGPYNVGTLFSLRISPPSVVISGSVLAGELSMSFSGAPNSTTLVQMTTNLASPASWQTIATNIADSNGQGQFTNFNLGQFPGHYYRAVTPDK
jgi:uncharacterized repeat protein (TIGR03803 family)